MTNVRNILASRFAIFFARRRQNPKTSIYTHSFLFLQMKEEIKQELFVKSEDFDKKTADLLKKAEESLGTTAKGSDKKTKKEMKEKMASDPISIDCDMCFKNIDGPRFVCLRLSFLTIFPFEV